jgi:hypothetical protein
MTGRSAEEIIASVGSPNSISAMAGNQRLLQWQATGCHMALLFDGNDRFVKITHQHAQYRPFSSDSYAAPESDHSMAKVIGIIVGLIVGVGILISMFAS